MWPIVKILLVQIIWFWPLALTEPCFEVQKLNGCIDCLESLANETAIPKQDCWAAKVQRDFEAEATGFTGQLLSNTSSGDCHLLSSECPLKCLPSESVGFESWLPCRAPNAPAVSHLIFTIRAGVGLKSWDSFVTASGNAHVITMETENSTAEQPDMFRSDLLDNLNALQFSLPMREIRVVVYKANIPVIRLVFDASKPGLTAQGWFSHDNLKSSWPVADIAARTFNYFSVAGHVSTRPGWSHQRRFFINYNYGGCPVDKGVLMLMDTDDVCSFFKGDFTAAAAPRILFTASLNGHWATDVQRADRLSIFVA